MNKFGFKLAYQDWTKNIKEENPIKIDLHPEFFSMIKSGKEALEWCYELIQDNHSWQLIMLLNGIYNELNLERPEIPYESRSVYKDIIEIHKKDLEKILNKEK